MRVMDDDVTLPNGEKIILRVLSETETNTRRDYGIAEAVRVSNDLKNPESELYRTKVFPLRDATAESVVDVLVQGRITELVREANDLYRMDFIVPPDNATLLEEVDTALSQKTREDEVYAARAKHLLDGIKTYREKALALPRDLLNREIEIRAQQVYAELAAQDAELYYTLWCAAESGEKKRWKSVNEVKKLPPVVVSFLAEKYKVLDKIDPWEITKSISQGDVGRVDENDSTQSSG